MESCNFKIALQNVWKDVDWLEELGLISTATILGLLMYSFQTPLKPLRHSTLSLTFPQHTLPNISTVHSLAYHSGNGWSDSTSRNTFSIVSRTSSCASPNLSTNPLRLLTHQDELSSAVALRQEKFMIPAPRSVQRRNSHSLGLALSRRRHSPSLRFTRRFRVPRAQPRPSTGTT